MCIDKLQVVTTMKNQTFENFLWKREKETKTKETFDAGRYGKVYHVTSH
jgi:hypothetical protein